jgi:uncharacterized cupredoxin-like copper-binding protein
MRRSIQARRRSAVLLVAAGAAVGVVCAVVWPGGRADARARVVSVTEKDFAIKAPQAVRAGTFRIRVHNAGPDTHELLLARVGAGRLPLRPDGLTVDEDNLGHGDPELVDGMERGKTEEVTVTLAPGRYVLFCNMAGHYLSGMHTVLVVR